jgi:hypothetical protein
MLLTNVMRRLVGESVGAAAVTLLRDGELDTLALGQGNPWLLLTDDENVGLAGSEGVVNGILDVDNGETTLVDLAVGDNTDTTHVTTTDGHGDNTGIEADEVGDLAGGDVNLDGVVDLDGGVGVADAVNKKPKLAKLCPVLVAILQKFDSSPVDQPKLGPTTE